MPLGARGGRSLKQVPAGKPAGGETRLSTTRDGLGLRMSPESRGQDRPVADQRLYVGGARAPGEKLGARGPHVRGRSRLERWLPTT